MIREEVVSKLKADEPHLRARGVTRLALFGSVVRGEERPDSDVDILIDVDPNVKFSLLDHAGVMNRLEDLLGRPVEVCRRETLKPLLRDRILAEAMDIF
jgi:predicted nucleotidyltransferase